MTKRQARAPAWRKPRTWAGVVAVGGLGTAWFALRQSAVDGKAVDGKADGFQAASAPEATEAAAPAALQVSLRIYNSHLGHLRFASDGQSILALGTEGAAVRSTDDGQNWQTVETGTREFLVDSVADARSHSLIVVGSRGTILRSDDSAKSFQRVPVDTERSFRALSMATDASLVLAVGDEGTAYVSRDAGHTFVAENTGNPNYLSHVVRLPRRPAFIVGGDNAALLLRDDTGAWRPIPISASGMVTALSVLADGTLVAATQDGFILHSRDEGETWHESYKAEHGAFVVGFEANPSASVLIARTRKRELLFSNDHGKSFERLSFEPHQGIAKLGWVEGRGFIGVGTNGATLSSDRSGKHWAIEPAPRLERPFSLAIHPITQTVLVVGSSGLIARSTDRGKDYQIVRPGLGGILRSFADNSAAGCLVAVGLDATVVRSTDSGESWQSVPLGIDRKLELTSVVVEPKTRVLLASGTAGTLLRSSDCGGSWAPVRVTRSDLNFLLASEHSGVLALATQSPMLRSIDTGTTFAPVAMDTDATLRRAVALSPTEVVAAGDKGRIYRSIDAGSSFQRVPSGTEANLRALTYDPVHRSLWAAGDSGTVLCSRDAGSTWAVVSLPTQENLFVVGLAANGSSIWLGGNQGTVLRSSDGGAHFTQVSSGSTQTIRVIAFDPVSNEFVIAGVGGTLLRSVDGSRLARVAGSFEGRLDAALFHAPSGAMFLGGDRLIRMSGAPVP